VALPVAVVGVTGLVTCGDDVGVVEVRPLSVLDDRVVEATVRSVAPLAAWLTVAPHAASSTAAERTTPRLVLLPRPRHHPA
jgi:hypothetical protein